MKGACHGAARAPDEPELSLAQPVWTYGVNKSFGKRVFVPGTSKSVAERVSLKRVLPESVT